MSYYAKRGNKVLKISDDAMSRYLAQGYTITDMSGNVVKKGTPTDVTLLRGGFEQQKTEIEQLKAKQSSLLKTIDSLKNENATLKAEIEKLKSVETETEVVSTEEEPRTTRKRRTSKDAEQ